MAGTLKRIQDLFRRGDVVVLESGGEKIPVYVAKLNALEKDESVKDARSARARRMLAFDRDEDEQAQIEVLLGGMTDLDVSTDLLRRKNGELLLKADDELRADTKWKERLEILDRRQLSKDGKVTEQEQELILAVAIEYNVEVEKIHAKALRIAKRELDATPRPELEKEYRRAWREMLGSTSFYENRRQTEIWYSLRECEVAFDDDGQPDLATLVVGQRVCSDRASVNDLGDEVIKSVLLALDGEMTSREAGNSDAPSASSGSSGQQNVEADSKPSTPKETSRSRAGTSRKPSPLR
jgi:hypothetical protein